jgi:hypothetical protein
MTITQVLAHRSLQFPMQVKVMTEKETKEYHLKKLYNLSLRIIGEILQLDEPTDEQKQCVLHRLKQRPEYWQRWFEGQYFTQEHKETIALTDTDISGKGIKKWY